MEVVVDVLSSEGDGHGFEREVVGHTTSDVPAEHRCTWVNNFREGINAVRGHQCHLNWDPKRPKTDLSRALYSVVNSRLKRKGELYLFDAVGTILDLRWGVDCWFECGDQIATVDLTVSHFKKYFKAHFLLRRIDFLWNRYYGVGRAIARRLSC
jgi:hypothetical protein